jgi:hypothetical protein
MTRQLLRSAARILITVVVAAASMTTGIALAQAATRPGWRIVQTFGPPGGVSFVTDMSAAGLGDAWATINLCDLACVAGGSQQPAFTLEHWNGRNWSSLARPAGVLADAISGPVSAISARDVWLFAATQAFTVSTVNRTYLLHWNHGRWTVFHLPKQTSIDELFAFSDTNVWAFGSTFDSKVKPYDLHYNGRHWLKVSLPIFPESASALSARDMWVVGPTVGSANKQGQEHFGAELWNGRSWRPTPLVPKIPTPRGFTSGVFGAVAFGPNDLWSQYSFAQDGCCRAGGLLHWNGRSWRRVAIPRYIQVFEDSVQDGHGGLWIDASRGETQWLVHYSRGRWTRTVVPTEKNSQDGTISLSWVPRSTAVWGFGSINPTVDPHDLFQAVVLKFGP